MLEVGTHTEVFRRLGLCKPILSLYIILLSLAGSESRSEKRHRCRVAPVARDANGAEICLKSVFLLSVEIYFKRLYILKRAKGSLSALGLEGIVVVRDIANDVEAP